APVIDILADDRNDPGEVVWNRVTGDSTPIVIGYKAEPGGMVHIMSGTTELGTAAVGPDGSWAFFPDAPLADGDYRITAVAEDAAGNLSPASEVFEFTVDTVTPYAPAISTADDDVGGSQGSMGNGSIIDDTTPELKGTAEANSIVHIYRDGTEIGTTQANGSGEWRYTSEALNEGTYIFTARAEDAAGNIGVNSDDFLITVDTGPTGPITPIEGDNNGMVGMRGDGFTNPGHDVYRFNESTGYPNEVEYEIRSNNNGRETKIIIGLMDEETGEITTQTLYPQGGQNDATYEFQVYHAPHGQVITSFDFDLSEDPITSGYDYNNVNFSYHDSSANSSLSISSDQPEIFTTEDVLSRGTTDLFSEESDEQLMINKEIGSSVEVSNEENWSAASQTMVDGVSYNGYTSAEYNDLLIQQGANMPIS
ncbi:hypothetical protein LLA49_003626, partial [Salmonella enterica]|nr:hypothetical protein [Salmonella enterica]